MKKFSLSLLIVLMAFGNAIAQQTVNKEEVTQQLAEGVPQAVLAAVEKSNQGFRFKKELPPAVAVKKSSIRIPKEGELKNHYAVLTWSSSVKGNTRKKALYNADGSFISSRTVSKACSLPTACLRTIGKGYNGWLLVSTKSVTKVNGADSTVYYRVVLKNGSKKEKLLLNEDGQIFKNKRALKKQAQEEKGKMVL